MIEEIGLSRQNDNRYRQTKLDYRMQGQRINNWDRLYQGDHVPQWEDLKPNREFLSLIRAHCSPGTRVLEIGAGLGHNALALARGGVDVTASDCSENAVRRCAEMAGQDEISVECRVLDVMRLPPDIGTYDLVFDKGCWHTFFEREFQKRFVEQIGTLLAEGGLWINATGSADNPDDPDDSEIDSYPRWTLGEIVRDVEACFEILQVRKGRYGYREDTRFRTWEGVFKKRRDKCVHRAR